MPEIKKGLYNITRPTIVNVVLVLCLILILSLIYLQNNKIDLFEPTLPNFSGNDTLTSFINKYVSKIQQQNEYSKVLATKQQTINSLTNRITNLINKST